ncbi:putative salicylate carboxymethyltransferase [Helianthus anomalus]
MKRSSICSTFLNSQYTASPTEIMNLVKTEGSFTIDHLEIFDNRKKHGVAKAIRAGIEPLVANHFGEAILDDVFMRYGQILTERESKKENQALVSITVSLTRKM